MSYKSTLQEHNTLLQEAINKANALPDAGSSGGSGGDVSTCNVTLDSGDYGWMAFEGVFYTAYTDGTIETKLVNAEHKIDIEDEETGEIIRQRYELENVVKNTRIFCVSLINDLSFSCDGAVPEDYDLYFAAVGLYVYPFEIVSDATITITA